MKEIRRRDPRTGTLYLRDGVTVAFFLSPPLHEIADAILAAFEAYLKTTPADALRWESVGASSEEWKPVTKGTIQRCRAQLMPEPARKRRLTSFELTDGNIAGDAPGYGIIVIGNPVRTDMPDEKCLMQMYYPSEVLQEEQVQGFVEKVRSIAALLPYVSGYASPGLQWAELGWERAIRESQAIAVCHPGYDLQVNETGRKRLGSRVRGARWISFLGPDIVEKLGGTRALRSALAEAVIVEEVGHGVMIRAGEVPEIGDRAHRIGTPLLRSVARVLEPVTAFKELVLLREFNHDEEFLEKWEHRFLD